MDIPDKTNKALDGSSVETKDVQPTFSRAASVLENDYFYPASNGYQAITIRAATREDAHAIYVARRQLVTSEKVEAENNQ